MFGEGGDGYWDVGSEMVGHETVLAVVEGEEEHSKEPDSVGVVLEETE